MCSYIYQCYKANNEMNENSKENSIYYIVIGDIYKKYNETINHNKIICYINSDDIEYYNVNSNDNTLYKKNNNNKNKTESFYDSVYITEIHNDLHNKSWIYKKIDTTNTTKNIIKQGLLNYPTEETLQNKIIFQQNNIYELYKMYKNNNTITEYGEKYINSYIQEIKHKINIIHITTTLLENL
jgi:hypothetical protein